jgi:hypothetical protein
MEGYTDTDTQMAWISHKLTLGKQVQNTSENISKYYSCVSYNDLVTECLASKETTKL